MTFSEWICLENTKNVTLLSAVFLHWLQRDNKIMYFSVALFNLPTVHLMPLARFKDVTLFVYADVMPKL